MSEQPATVGEHTWVPSTLGHGVQMCKWCKGTDAELRATGELGTCESAPQPASPAPSCGVEEIEAVIHRRVSINRAMLDHDSVKRAAAEIAALSRNEGAAEGVEKRVERVVRDHFYPGPLAGSAARLSAALIAEFGLASAPASPADGGGGDAGDIDFDALDRLFAGIPDGPWDALHSQGGWEVRQVDTDPQNKHHWPHRLCESIAGHISRSDEAAFNFIAAILNTWPTIRAALASRPAKEPK